MRRFAVVLVAAAALVVAAAATAAPRVAPADRASVNALLDRFIPDVVRGQDPVAGRRLVGRYVQVGSVQHYPAKGSHFDGWLVNYASPGDVGFDILLQPTRQSLGAWSFRGEAQKVGGNWKITAWYTVATYAPPGKTQTVIGPNDFGPGASPGAVPGGINVDHGRLPPWVLALPFVVLGALALVGAGIAGVRWARARARVREIERSLSA